MDLKKLDGNFQWIACGFDQRTIFHLGKSSSSNNCAELEEKQETNWGERKLVYSQKDLSDEILWSGDQRVANILIRLVHFYEGWYLLNSGQGLPGSPVRSLVREDPTNRGGVAIKPMHYNHWSHTLEPVLHKGSHNEKPAQSHKAQLSLALAATRESSHATMKTRCSQKEINKNFKSVCLSLALKWTKYD